MQSSASEEDRNWLFGSQQMRCACNLVITGKAAWTTKKRVESMGYTEERLRKHGLHRREKKVMDYTEERRKHGLHAQKREESMDNKEERRRKSSSTTV